MVTNGSFGIAAALDALLSDYETLTPRMRHIEFPISDTYERIAVRGTDISFREGVPTFDDFISAVHARITEFCLPRRELRAAYDQTLVSDPQDAASIWTALVTNASELFIRAKKESHRSGEGAIERREPI